MRGELKGKIRSTPSPSTIRWCTSTWSPIWIFGRSFFRSVASTCANSLCFMFVFLPNLASVLSPAGDAPAAGLRLFAAPAGHRLMITAEEHLGNRQAAKLTRPRVLGILQPARVAVRLVGDTRG